jgi:hypothetical protein
MFIHDNFSFPRIINIYKYGYLEVTMEVRVSLTSHELGADVQFLLGADS